MAEERRICIRIALFTAGAGAVYWLVSYELAGTVLLAAVTLATLGLGLMLGSLASEPSLSLRRRALDLATFEEPGDAVPLELAQVPFPGLSLQPLLLAIGAGAVAAGLVFGAWLWLPGAVLTAATAGRWFTEL